MVRIGQGRDVLDLESIGIGIGIVGTGTVGTGIDDGTVGSLSVVDGIESSDTCTPP